MKNKYAPVPVSVAREIAKKYSKAIVIINTWDTTHGLLHTTTYGESVEQKHQAASGGDIAAKALGADMPRANYSEDFRKDGVVVSKTVIEATIAALKSYQYGNSAPDLAEKVIEAIEKELK